MRSLLLTGLIFFFGVSLLHGQTISRTGLEVENHEEFDVLVEDLSQYALDIGLTKNRIESRVNVRLRQVGVRRNPDITNYLYIQTNVVGTSFSIILSFNRIVSFSKGDQLYRTFGAVYAETMTGMHGRDPEFIISRLDILLDQFLSDYLEAND